jgi:3-phenylpropionate/trans-cinnamate dioxygenase ferredoxin reductase subunit
VSAGVLIVGASQAGVQLAVSLRQEGWQQSITLLGAEPSPPYQRPPLSKGFLLGTADEESLAFRSHGFYAEQGIDVVCGERVVDVFLHGDGPAGEARTDQGRTLTFGHLALTVGARPRRLSVPGAQLGGVRYLRDVDDARLLRRDLEQSSTVVVIGGGYIGLEAAAVARQLGKSVTVVEAADRLIARSVAPVVSEFYLQAHRRRGTNVHLGAAVTGLTGAPRVTGVDLSDGTHLPADLVLVGVGVIPRTELAERLGLACHGGIVVDEYARTSVPTVVAAGDCTVLPNPVSGAGLVRLESVQNAVDQARTAAATLAGRRDPQTAVPWFWSDQYDLKLQIAGLSAGYDDVVVRGDPDGERFSVLYYRSGALIAVDAVNSVADYLTVRRALGQHATIPAEQARSLDTPLKGLVVARVPA